MRLGFISDTHELHENVVPVEVDVLFFTGDFSNHGLPIHLESFISWLKDYPAKVKVFIAGNHDLSLDHRYAQTHVNSNPLIYHNRLDCIKLLEDLPKDIIYLHDSSTNLEKYVGEELNVYGSPYSEKFGDWAFGYESGQSPWHKIPSNTHVLLTHTPPYGILDRGSKLSSAPGKPLGCPELRERLNKLNVLKIHAYGHIHENYGSIMHKITNTKYRMFVNSALVPDGSLSKEYELLNKYPIIVNI